MKALTIVALGMAVVLFILKQTHASFTLAGIFWELAILPTLILAPAMLLFWLYKKFYKKDSSEKDNYSFILMSLATNIILVLMFIFNK